MVLWLNMQAIKQCVKSLNEQIEVVAEFHAHKIAPERIAYRTGVELQLIQDLVAGEYKPRLFKHLLKQAKLRRREQRLQASLRLKGTARTSKQAAIETEFTAEKA